ncbi:MAG: helix-turn-helix transcriptional regulator [Verrucomicrobiae bacterium]|nr:helix-turn-helix transcriptional regulator [Verrucomicrobiae bacterium]
MSYLSTALKRRAERRQLNQSDLAKLSGISRSYMSRLFSGEFQELSDENFIGLLKVFATEPEAQAELVAARCMDARVGPGSELVEIMVKATSRPAANAARLPAGVDYPVVELSHETEKAFAWLRSQCPLNPDLEKHLVGYAKLTGMK